jgi:hypothetical protein
MRLRLLASLLLCAGCADGQADLRYAAPPAPIQAPLPLVADVRVDDRRVGDPALLATVAGFDDLPLKREYAAPSVAEATAAAFRSALAARGALAPPGDGLYDLDVTLLQLGAEQHAVRQASVDMLLALVDRRNGRVAWSTRVYAEERGDDWLAYDNLLFGSPEALGALANLVLDRAIDRSLDRSGFILALR